MGRAARCSPMGLLTLFVVFSWACGDTTGTGGGGGGGSFFKIDSTRPSSGSTGISETDPIVVYFNHALSIGTIDTSTLQLHAAGAAVPHGLMYNPITHAVLITAPLTPSATFTVTVTSGLRDSSGDSLKQAATVPVTTRSWSPQAIQTNSSVISNTSLVIRTDGSADVAFWDATNQDLKYARCSAPCTGTSTWLVASVDTVGDVGFSPVLAIDHGGRLNISYLDNTNSDLKFATCTGPCSSMQDWQRVTVDSVGHVGVGTLAAGPDNRLHIVYEHFGSSLLKYATCDTGCATISSWRDTVIATSVVGVEASAAVDGGGRLHVTYRNTNNGGLDAALKYATCATGCLAPGNWQTTTVDSSSGGGTGYYSAIALGAFGSLHVAYYDLAHDDLRYGTCASSCTSTPNWSFVRVDTIGSTGDFPALVVAPNGRVHIGYHSFAAAGVRYASCLASCASASAWFTHFAATSDPAILSIGLDVAGHAHLLIGSSHLTFLY
jgi:hypothetical protein